MSRPTHENVRLVVSFAVHATSRPNSRMAARMVRRFPMPHGFPQLRGRVTAALATMLLSLVMPALQAQTPAPPTSFTYHDAQGDGRFLLYDVGPDDVTGGRQIKVSLTQNGLSYYGSGFTLPLQTTMPYKTLISFTLV